MAEYYLISQLPSLDALGENAPLPITQERFFELCESALSKRALDELNAITLIPDIEPKKTSSALVSAWNEGERDLRLCLCKARADKMGKAYDLQNKKFSTELLKIVNTAVDIENPLDAEKFLLNYRLSFLETLRPMDSFSLEYVFYYALKLKLISRIRQFDVDKSKSTYKNIYTSILSGSGLEDI